MRDLAYFEEGAVDWLEVPEEWQGKAARGEPGVRFKVLSDGASGVPGIQLIEFEPGHHENAHSHPESEILYVLDGQMRIGERTLRAGSGAFITRDTVYGPLDTAGGVRFLRIGLAGLRPA
jgi:quercetin dioxygenase-like cupin family protein